jgi:hypothetical protein
MSAEEPEGEEEEEPTLRNLRPSLYRMIYNQPGILLSMFETLFELLESRGVMRPGEAEMLIREGIRRWRDEIGPE